MIKIIIFGLLAVGAFAQIGGMDKLKNLKMKDVKEMLDSNPSMMKAAEGMGMSPEQIKEALNNMPEDIELSSIFDKLGENKDQIKSKVGEQLGAMKEEMKTETIGQFKEEMSNMGIDLSEGPAGLKDQLLPKIKEMMEKELKSNGVDVDNQEELRNKVNAEIRMMVGAKEDTTDEEVRDMIKEKITEEMKQDGVEIDQGDMKGGLKQKIFDYLKNMGIDMENGLDKDSLKDMMKNMMKSEL